MTMKLKFMCSGCGHVRVREFDIKKRGALTTAVLCKKCGSPIYPRK